MATPIPSRRALLITNLLAMLILLTGMWAAVTGLNALYGHLDAPFRYLIPAVVLAGACRWAAVEATKDRAKHIAAAYHDKGVR